MKTLFFKLAAVLSACTLFVSCGDSSLKYTVALPPPPAHWDLLPGKPYWRVEWLDSGGQKQSADILPGGALEIELPATWANPVTAWPYWPETLPPGLFRPAGAIFPFDASGESLYLSWEAGPDTVFYMELAFANTENSSKIPANFDWPRFRELFDTDKLNQAVREDPWLVDWRSAAEKTISSNFDSRRLIPESAESLPIPVPSGTWYGTSPFAKPLFFADGVTPEFPVRPGLNLWFSAHGILRVSGKAWVFSAW